MEQSVTLRLNEYSRLKAIENAAKLKGGFVAFNLQYSGEGEYCYVPKSIAVLKIITDKEKELKEYKDMC